MSSTTKQLFSLDTYDGSFEFQQAKHLLRRAMYGVNLTQINEAVDRGLEATIDKLFEDLPHPMGPLNYAHNHPEEVPLGETWANELIYNTLLDERRRFYVRYWICLNKYFEGISVREKMMAFWTTHFVCTSILSEALTTYHYVNLLYQHVVGNFKTLTEKMTIEPLMLYYLSGDSNVADAPNENYARELLELFTLGKGATVTSAPDSPADYTHYTEHDVLEIAKVLTGWKAEGGYNATVPPGSYFEPADHDNTVKTLSHRFDHQTIQPNGENEYKDLLNIIFAKEECAKHICRRLYRFFVYHDISEEVETHIIAPMAEILRANNYEIKPALKALLSSKHFFDSRFMGAMLKNPHEYRLSFEKGFCNSIDLSILESKHLHGYRTFAYLGQAMMPLLDLPDVAGWPAYYHAPNYYQMWLSSSSIRSYIGTIDWNIKWGDRGVNYDLLEKVQELEAPEIVDHLITEWTKVHWPCPITPERLAYLKEILIPGLPDEEWTIEYNNWLANPNSQFIANEIREKLSHLIKAIFSLPEFYMN